MERKGKIYQNFFFVQLFGIMADLGFFRNEDPRNFQKGG